MEDPHEYLRIWQDLLEAIKKLDEATRNLRSFSGQSTFHSTSKGDWAESRLRLLLAGLLLGPKIDDQSIKVSSGFFLQGENEISHQQDILLRDAGCEKQFKSDTFVIVRDKNVHGLVEVKWAVPNGAAEVILKLSENVRRLRGANPEACAGLFCFLPNRRTDWDRKDAEHFLAESVARPAIDSQGSVVDFIALGWSVFVRYWRQGERLLAGEREEMKPHTVDKPFWAMYRLKDLAFAYFAYNVVTAVSRKAREIPIDKLFPVGDFPDRKHLIATYPSNAYCEGGYIRRVAE